MNSKALLLAYYYNAGLLLAEDAAKALGLEVSEFSKEAKDAEAISALTEVLKKYPKNLISLDGYKEGAVCLDDGYVVYDAKKTKRKIVKCETIYEACMEIIKRVSLDPRETEEEFLKKFHTFKPTFKVCPLTEIKGYCIKC